MRKLSGVCRNCKHVSSTTSGEICSKASYNYSEYGVFWKSNECIFDQNHPKLKSLFEPVCNDDLLTSRNIEIELRGKILELKEENRKLRSLIK